MALLPDLPIVRRTLANGLRVVLQEDRSLPLVAVNLWYHVGSKNERPGRTGFAHLFEHMLFQGSAHVGTNDHFHYLQQVGGVANGSTWYDRTNYYETVPAHHLELALWLESDRMGFLLPALTAEKLENQRAVVMNERRERVDNQPYGHATERLHELLYPPDHPYHWPVIGYLPDIAAASLDEVRAFFSTHYRPNNAVLSLVGDFDPQQAGDLVERYFGDLAAGHESPLVAAPNGQTAGGAETLEDAVELPRIYLGYRVPPYGTRDWYALDLLASALSEGKATPLYRDLVYERQAAQEASVALLAGELDGTFYTIATCRPGVDPAHLEELLDGHLERAAAEPLTPEILEAARRRTVVGALEEFESFEERADVFSQLTTLFDAPE
ncbi:MAG: M16 family metallopeptidase, partial [Thermoanaerobaculia bacterium]